ncbi:M56 family metallopeptidase [Streptomyces palmae]|uniref:M56 family peptidase n=1 Tax=Streptomyces palmae TaxID=1701085 RepID=A0A4Z0HA83_9ACTN|nr:M56 family metallopeptidase [Streptomyces palmae]TGB09645.1 M56 family peptidase [Streptomyces palmae]
MIYAIWAPLLVPFLAVPVARRLAPLLAPRAAAWLLAVSGAVLAGCTTAALGLLALEGALRLRPVASLGRLRLPLLADGVAASPPVAALALALLAATAVAACRLLLRLLREWVAARRHAPAGGGGDLSVIDDGHPDAFALPGRPGRIVVTAGMLRALDPAEREALFAHERAHLAGRHHLFLALADLVAVCHPVLRGLRAPLGYALERWADEAAARAVGDRTLTARAIARAALATRAAEGSGSAHRRPRFAVAATTGPVPRRVAALLGTGEPARPRSRALRRVAAAAIAGCLVFSVGAALDAATDLHGSIEVAQAAPEHP